MRSASRCFAGQNPHAERDWQPRRRLCPARCDVGNGDADPEQSGLEGDAANPSVRALFALLSGLAFLGVIHHLRIFDEYRCQ